MGAPNLKIYSHLKSIVMKKLIAFYVIFMLVFGLTVTANAAPTPYKHKCGWKLHKKQTKGYKSQRRYKVIVKLR